MKSSPSSALHSDTTEASDRGIVITITAEALEPIVERAVGRALESNGGGSTASYLTAREAAAHLRWPLERIYKLSAARAIPHIKHQGRLLFRRHELDDWLSSFAVRPVAGPQPSLMSGIEQKRL